MDAQPTTRPTQTSPWLDWTPKGRTLVFILSATSIWSLLAQFYGLSSMRAFALWLEIPATFILIGMAIWDWKRGSGRLARAVVLGAVAGFLAAVAYDVFRLPFVFAKQMGMDSVVPPLPLFKVFPRFGALLLGQPVEQEHYSLMAYVVGWTYHFSNGITFGVMYLALIGDGLRRSWWWAVLFAVGLEMALLLTPYPGFFDIKVTSTFIAVTLTAHMVFGVAMGLLVRRFSRTWPATLGAA